MVVSFPGDLLVLSMVGVPHPHPLLVILNEVKDPRAKHCRPQVDVWLLVDKHPTTSDCASRGDSSLCSE
jgi:hypothetical protein